MLMLDLLQLVCQIVVYDFSFKLLVLLDLITLGLILGSFSKV
jgi:hypothetical protein